MINHVAADRLPVYLRGSSDGTRFHSETRTKVCHSSSRGLRSSQIILKHLDHHSDIAIRLRVNSSIDPDPFRQRNAVYSKHGMKVTLTLDALQGGK